jgi:hypothetical protein
MECCIKFWLEIYRRDKKETIDTDMSLGLIASAFVLTMNAVPVHALFL